MPRVKRGTIKRKKKRKIFSLTKGYRGGRRNLYRTAKETIARSLAYSYRDRKVRKREFRRLWIQRINAMVREHGLTYSEFIHGLKQANIELDRKILAEMAVSSPEEFRHLIQVAKASLS